MRAVRQELLQVGALRLGMHTSTEEMIRTPTPGRADPRGPQRDCPGELIAERRAQDGHHLGGRRSAGTNEHALHDRRIGSQAQPSCLILPPRWTRSKRRQFLFATTPSFWSRTSAAADARCGATHLPAGQTVEPIAEALRARLTECVASSGG